MDILERNALDCDRLVFDPDLIRKYDRNGPRYTSYPTADRFAAGFDAQAYEQALARRAGSVSGEPLSLYFHLPFCATVCFYCGCNKVVTRNRARATDYVDALLAEIDMHADRLGERCPVDQMHWGGGTPTFLPDAEMERLMAAIRRRFDLRSGGEYSIEVDPRAVGTQTLTLLGFLGFNRISVGVQDFDIAVQRAVNRIQSEEQTRETIEVARRAGFRSVSIDLICGLPRQTLEGFSHTIERVLASDPDRIAIYNYAHLPALFKPQRQIDPAELPSPETRLELMRRTIERLVQAGYVYIGMDHFAKPEDDLARAYRGGHLQRNFQGYSTHADCDLIAFGTSAIGKIGPTYSQNVRTLDEYYERIGRGELPILRGFTLDADDVLRREVIHGLMCGVALDTRAVERRHGIDFAAYFGPELEDLNGMADDGLVSISADAIRIEPRGRLLVRNIGMVFDRYLRQSRSEGRYSRTI